MATATPKTLIAKKGKAKVEMIGKKIVYTRGAVTTSEPHNYTGSDGLPQATYSYLRKKAEEFVARKEEQAARPDELILSYGIDDMPDGDGGECYGTVKIWKRADGTTYRQNCPAY